MPDKPQPTIQDGQRMAILRPLDPARVVAETKEIVRKQNSGEMTSEEAMAAINEVGRDQERTFIGILTTDQLVMDPDTGLLVEGERPQPGDIFVSYEELLASEADWTESSSSEEVTESKNIIES